MTTTSIWRTKLKKRSAFFFLSNSSSNSLFTTQINSRKRRRFEQRFGDLQMSYQEQLQYVMLVSQQEALTATSRATGTLEEMSEEEQLQYALLISQQQSPSPGGIGVCS